MLVDRLAADADDDDIETDDELVTVRLARGIFASLPGRPQRRRGLLVARPVALRREFREARRHRARRRHLGAVKRPTSRTGCAASGTSTCRARRNRRPRSRASQRCSRKRIRAGRRRAEVGADDDDLRRGGTHRRRARRRVRHGRRPHRPEPGRRSRGSSTTARSPTTPRICAACPSRRSPRPTARRTPRPAARARPST